MNEKKILLSPSNHMIEATQCFTHTTAKSPLILWHHYRSIISILLRNAMKRVRWNRARTANSVRLAHWHHRHHQCRRFDIIICNKLAHTISYCGATHLDDHSIRHLNTKLVFWARTKPPADRPFTRRIFRLIWVHHLIQEHYLYPWPTSLVSIFLPTR